MALLSDNSDITVTFLRITTGNDGDYYPEILFRDEKGLTKSVCIRVAISGGNAPIEVKIAIANLYRALEKNNLNEHPSNEHTRWPNLD